MLVGYFILAALGLRFLPHLWNMAPVGAMLLLAGGRMKPRHMWIALAALMASDFVLTLGVYHLPTMRDQYFTWAADVMILALGYAMLRGRLRLPVLASASVLCSTIFYLVSNFGVWLAGGLYPHTAAGLASCMTLALPFYRNTLAGDMFYSLVFFSLYAWLSQRQAARMATA